MLSEISSDRERKMLYDFTDMCNPKIKQMSKQNKTETVIDTEKKQVVSSGEEAVGRKEKGEGD